MGVREGEGKVARGSGARLRRAECNHTITHRFRTSVLAAATLRRTRRPARLSSSPALARSRARAPALAPERRARPREGQPAAGARLAASARPSPRRSLAHRRLRSRHTTHHNNSQDALSLTALCAHAGWRRARAELFLFSGRGFAPCALEAGCRPGQRQGVGPARGPHGQALARSGCAQDGHRCRPGKPFELSL